VTGRGWRVEAIRSLGVLEGVLYMEVSTTHVSGMIRACKLTGYE
jgi:hypothetical protein